LVQHGHQVIVATHTAPDQIAYTISPEVDVVRTPYPEYASSGILAWPKKTWWAIRQAAVLTDLIQKYRPTMVVDHGTAFGLVYPFGSLRGVPLVLQRHFPVRSFPRGKLLYRLLSLICCSKTTVVLTEAIADDMRALGYRKVRVIPNMIPAEANPAAYSRAVPKTGLLMGRGRTPQKGFDVFLEALARTRESDGWRFAIIGPGIESDPTLLELINRHHLACRVALLPATSDPYEHIRNSACLIVPSRYEGLPMVALEALRIGRPVIASDASISPAQGPGPCTHTRACIRRGRSP
jgi:amylovoran biosynthesis glycosyltransferase AmsD